MPWTRGMLVSSPVMVALRPTLVTALACLTFASRAQGQESMVTILRSLGSPATYSHPLNSVNGIYSQSFVTGASLPVWRDVDGSGAALFFIRWNLDTGRVFGYDPELDDMGIIPVDTYYQVDLRSDGGGRPGAALWTSGLFYINQPGVQLFGLHDFASSLQANTTYWLTLTLRGGQFADYPVVFATASAPAGDYATFGSLYFGDDPSTWSARNGSALLSIELEATPVPEASAVPLALGALGLALLARRRRDKSRARL